MKPIAQVLAFDLVSKVLLGFLSILFIRLMTAEEFAQLAFAVSIATLVGQVFASSFNRIYVIGYKHLRLESRFLSYLSNQALMVAVACAFILPFTGMSLDISLAVAFFALMLALFEATKSVYQQRQRFMRYSVLEMVRAVLVCSAIGTLVWYSGGILRAWQVLTVQALGMAIVFLSVLFILLAASERQKKTRKSDDKLLGQVVLGPYRYLFGYFMMLSLFSQLDILMLWFFDEEKQLAIYGSAFRYYGLLSLVLGAVHVVLLPAIQNARFGIDLADVFEAHKKVIMLFVPVLLVCVWGAGFLLPWVDEGRYPDAVLVFRILCVSAVVSLAFSPHVNWLMRARNFKFLFILICVACGANFVLNSALIPMFGARGVAVATAVSAAVVTIPIYFRSRSLLKEIPEEADVEDHLQY